MMSSPVRTYDITAKLSELVEEVCLGNDVVVEDKGKPVARVIPFPPTDVDAHVRGLGENLLRVTYISPDFDEPAWSDAELEEMGF